MPSDAKEQAESHFRERQDSDELWRRKNGISQDAMTIESIRLQKIESAIERQRQARLAAGSEKRQ